MKALVDGDVLVYQFGWSAQTSTFKVLNEKDDELFTGRNKTECKNFLKDLEEFGTDTVEYTTTEGESNCTPIEDTFEGIDNRLKWITKKANCDDMLVFLSGKTNFRNDVATIKPYKGNRKASAKPVYYEKIREYFLTKHSAILSVNEEADDLLGIYQEEDTVICTIDKDLLTVPGHHFNFKSAELSEVSKDESVYNLQYQHLLGDNVDNIPGIKGMGPVKTERALKGKTERVRWQVISNLYRNEYGDDWEKSLLEVGTLLYIRQKEGEVWKLPRACTERDS